MTELIFALPFSILFFFKVSSSRKSSVYSGTQGYHGVSTASIHENGVRTNADDRGRHRLRNDIQWV